MKVEKYMLAISQAPQIMYSSTKGIVAAVRPTPTLRLKRRFVHVDKANAHLPSLIFCMIVLARSSASSLTLLQSVV
jgi:hypothetical protein